MNVFLHYFPSDSPQKYCIICYFILFDYYFDIVNLLYSAPSSFERRFKKEFPLLYKYLQEAPPDKASHVSFLFNM